jgi:SAM-dependent methyltransferase
VSRAAIAWYEQNARYYDGLLEREPPQARADALRRLAAVVPAGGVVLEIGSAGGRDADFLCSLGVRVRRSDVTQGFIDLQAERGRKVERLDVLRDDLGGPHAGVLAMCVLLHVTAEATPGVLRRIAAALEVGGHFLVSVRAEGDPNATAWPRATFAMALGDAGLDVVWDDRDWDGDAWLVFLARRRGGHGP